MALVRTSVGTGATISADGPTRTIFAATDGNRTNAVFPRWWHLCQSHQCKCIRHGHLRRIRVWDCHPNQVGNATAINFIYLHLKVVCLLLTAGPSYQVPFEKVCSRALTKITSPLQTTSRNINIPPKPTPCVALNWTLNMNATVWPVLSAFQSLNLSMFWVYQRGWPENSQSSFPARHLPRSRMA